MKHLFFIIIFLMPFFSKAQEQKTFISEYERIMAEVKKWEVEPDSITYIRQRTSHNGRKVKIITLYIEKKILTGNRFRYVPCIRVQKIKLFKSGAKIEKLKMLRFGTSVGYLLKKDSLYFVIRIKAGQLDELMTDERIITIRDSRKNKYYFKKD